jgi:transcriptional regulator with GAF, ATPase, and Fis domain
MIGCIDPAQVSVLKLDPSGTGKELAARAQRPFVVAHCCALAGELLESEQFDHVCGTFTGTHNTQQG